MAIKSQAVCVSQAPPSFSIPDLSLCLEDKNTTQIVIYRPHPQDGGSKGRYSTSSVSA